MLLKFNLRAPMYFQNFPGRHAPDPLVLACFLHNQYNLRASLLLNAPGLLISLGAPGKRNKNDFMAFFDIKHFGHITLL